jgi:hypothetical protein
LTTFARPQALNLVDGYDTAGDPVEFEIRAYVQPMTDKETRDMPEGQNGEEWYNVWSLEEFKRRDMIFYRDQWHEIKAVSDWQEATTYLYRGRFVRTEDEL